MRALPFLRIENFRYKLLVQFLKRKSKETKVSTSTEDLITEITSKEYEEKIKSFVKQELFENYTQKTIEKVFQHVSFVVLDATKVVAKQNGIETIFLEQDLDILEDQIDLKESKSNYIVDDENIDEILKVKKRVPGWFKKPSQINTKILLAFMELLGDNNSVSYHKLETACRSLRTFKSNYNQMKIIGERNHAKVFTEIGSRITLWEPSREFVNKEYNKFKKKQGS